MKFNRLKEWVIMDNESLLLSTDDLFNRKFSHGTIF